MKFMNKNKKGFTLVELMIVVVIMAILVAVAVPIFNAVTTNAKNKTCAGNARILSGQVNTIAMNELGATGGEEANFNALTLTATTEVKDLIGGNTKTTFITYLQGKVLPVCPWGYTGVVYEVDETGKVTCSAADADGKHTAPEGD